MAMQFLTNAAYPTRIQWILNEYIGPFIQNGPLGELDPRRDLEIYVDGVLLPVLTYTFDSINNRYLLYMESPFNLQGVIQVIFSMPDPPFLPQNVTPVPVSFGVSFGLSFGS